MIGINPLVNSKRLVPFHKSSALQTRALVGFTKKLLSGLTETSFTITGQAKTSEGNTVCRVGTLIQRRSHYSENLLCPVTF